MSPLNALIFGLGLFFLGLRLVSENLNGFAGGSLRNRIAGSTSRPVLGVGLGLAAGALMQSATAVTFVCVSMVLAGLLGPLAAAGMILWCNVGLTALAFVATLDIHPVVAFIVGGAGIVLGVVRIRSWQTFAGVLLGMGLILLGLQQMSEGASPLRNEAWFRTGIDFAVSSPPLAFFAGMLAAAILQSNTGATMMVITLAGAGALQFADAAILIYGTNLGAIALRAILASGMKGKGLQLVRLEDLFCVFSGLLMMLLYFLEMAGVPLVLAFSNWITHSVPMALAVVFFLSNLLPAIVLTPFLPATWKFLDPFFQEEVAFRPGSPRYLSAQALGHASTALDLLRREIARLLGLIGLSVTEPKKNGKESTGDDFQELSAEIEDFLIKLASRSAMAEKETESLHRLRATLSGIRHLEDACRFFRVRSQAPTVRNSANQQILENALADMIRKASLALDQLDISLLADLELRSKKHGVFLDELREMALSPDGKTTSLDESALFEDFQLVMWTYHHLLKIFLQLASASDIRIDCSPAESSR